MCACHWAWSLVTEQKNQKLGCFYCIGQEVTKQCPRLDEVHRPVLFDLHSILLNFGPTFKIQVLNLKVIHKIQDLKIRVSVNTGLVFLPTTLDWSRSDLIFCMPSHNKYHSPYGNLAYLNLQPLKCIVFCET